MDTNVDVSAPFVPSKEQVSIIARDQELRRMKPGSDEYRVAIQKKFGNGISNSAPTTENIKEPVTPKDASGQQTDASVTDEETVEGFEKPAVAKRIAKLLAERKASDARAAKLEAELNEARAGKSQVKETSTAVADTSKFNKPKPELANFKSYEEHQEALFDWKMEKRDFDREQATNAKKTQETATNNLNKFWDAGKILEKEMGLDEGDFRTLIDGDDVRKFDSTVQSIVESPFAAQIAFELANLSDEAKEAFNKMNPAQQLIRIGRIEAKFEAKKQTAETKVVSAAKAPGRPLKKGSVVATGMTIRPGMDFRAYEATRKAMRPDKFRR